MDTKMVLIQLIGLVGYIIIGISYFRKKKIDILSMQVIAYVFFTIHYYLLSGLTGATCNAVGLVSLFLIYLNEKYKLTKSEYLVNGIVIVFIVILALTYQNIYSLFPILASIISISSFLSKNENFIREIGMVSALSWLVYAIVYKSYVSIVYEVILLISTIIAFRKNSKNSQKN